MIDLQCPSNVHMTQESCHFENPDSISSYQLELDQHQILDSLASYPFSEIKLEDECEPELQFSDSTLINVTLHTWWGPPLGICEGHL